MMSKEPNRNKTPPPFFMLMETDGLLYHYCTYSGSGTTKPLHPTLSSLKTRVNQKILFKHMTY